MGGTLKHLTMVYVTNLVNLEALMQTNGGGTLKHLTMVYHVKNLIMLNGRYIEALNYGIPRYKPCYGSRGGTLKHLTLWYTTLQTLLCLNGRYIEALNFVLVYHVKNLIMAQWEVH